MKIFDNFEDIKDHNNISYDLWVKGEHNKFYDLWDDCYVFGKYDINGFIKFKSGTIGLE